jgi:choline dehydrogenase-like flavoprotein
MTPAVGSILWTASTEAVGDELDVHVTATHLLPGSLSPTGGAIALLSAVVQPEATGTLKLASRDPDDAPLIDPNYLGTSSDTRRLDQVGACPTQVTGVGAQLQGQAGLTDTAHADQRDKPLSFPEQRPEFVQLSFSADESGHGPREAADGLEVIRVIAEGVTSGVLCLAHASNHDRIVTT